MTEAYIQPNLLQWAVERSQMPLDAIARSVQVKLEQVTSWQEGETSPTFSQAQTLAHVLRIPFGYLFLSDVPIEKLPIPDLRTLTNKTPQKLSLDFLELLSDVKHKQDWYREYLIGENSQPLEFVGQYSYRDNPDVVAEAIRLKLEINEDLREDVTSWTDFLTRIVQLSEANGILVQRSGIVGSDTTRKLSVKEFRGFAISDNYAPLIFINSSDYKVAQIFTLAHELAHLWIGESGISNLTLNKPIAPSQTIEFFCNQVAAELLVPRAQFLPEWKKHISLEKNINHSVRKFRVSTIVILRRAFDLGLIARSEFFEQYEIEIAKHNKDKTDTTETKKGGNFYTTLKARNGGVFVNTVMTSAYEGRLLYRDAASLLGVKIYTVDKIAKRLGLR